MSSSYNYQLWILHYGFPKLAFGLKMCTKLIPTFLWGIKNHRLKVLLGLPALLHEGVDLIRAPVRLGKGGLHSLWTASAPGPSCAAWRRQRKGYKKGSSFLSYLFIITIQAWHQVWTIKLGGRGNHCLWTMHWPPPPPPLPRSPL